MNRDHLADHVLGLLDSQESALLNEHLESTPQDQQEIARLRIALTQLALDLEPVAPPSRVWQRIQRTINPEASSMLLQPRQSSPARPGWLLSFGAIAASMLLVVTIWGLSMREQTVQLEAQNRLITDWLTRPNIREQAILNRKAERVGTLLVLPDGRSLIVMRDEPSAGTTFQAWGLPRPGPNQLATSLGLLHGRIAEIHFGTFKSLWISIEPSGGSTTPTQPIGTAALTS